MLRHMVPVTYLFVRLFGEGTWPNTLFSRFGTVALLEDWGNTMGVSVSSSFFLSGERVQLTMNLSIKTSCFRSKTDTESSCWQSTPGRSSTTKMSKCQFKPAESEHWWQCALDPPLIFFSMVILTKVSGYPIWTMTSLIWSSFCLSNGLSLETIIAVVLAWVFCWTDAKPFLDK